MRKAVSTPAMGLLVAIGARGIKTMSHCLNRTVEITNSASEGKRRQPWRVIVKLFKHHL